MSFFDRTGAGECSGGETVHPALEIEGQDGALVDLTGRTFIYQVTEKSGAVRLYPPADADLSGYAATFTNAGTRAVADLPGDITRTLARKSGLEHWWIEAAEAGFVEWNRAGLKVLSAGPLAEGASAPGDDVLVVNDKGVLRIVAAGAPGASLWSASGQTLEEYQQERIDGPVDAAVERADDAADAATEAVALLEGLTGEQVPLLIALLIPPGATAIAADSRNSVLFVLGII